MGKYVPYNIWFIMLFGAQGYAIKKTEYIKTIKVQFVWQRIDEIHVRETLDTYI